LTFSIVDTEEAPIVKRDLKFEATYPHAIEKVWRAITDPAAIKEWLMPNDFQPKLGHKFMFTSTPQPGWDGKSYCEVIEFDPPRRLAYTWRGGPIDTVLRITLEPVASGTRLVLEHTGFRGVKAVLVSLVMGSGWKGIVHKHIPAVLARLNDDGTLRPKELQS
jgi:uncharacterized protein YndB with AHSA1/START domain